MLHCDSILTRAYKPPEGGKMACIPHRHTVYGKIQTWKRDVLYLATRWREARSVTNFEP